MRKFFTLCLLFALSCVVYAADTYTRGGVTITVDGTEVTFETTASGQIEGGWHYTSDGAIKDIMPSTVTNVIVKGPIGTDDFNRLSAAYGNGSNSPRMDLSQATGFATPTQNVSDQSPLKQLILPKGADFNANVYGSLDYVIVAGDANTDTKVYIINGTNWANDPFITNLDNSYNISVREATNPNTEVTNAQTEQLLANGKTVNGLSSGVTLEDLTIDANSQNVSATISDFLNDSKKINKLTVTGTMSDLNALDGVQAKSVDLSGLTNTSIDGLKLPTTSGEIKLPGGVTYNNGNVSISTGTTLDQLSEALKVLKDNGKSFSSVPLPGGSTYSDGKLTLSSADEANLADICEALTNAGLTISKVDFASGTKFDNGTLIVSSDDDNETNLSAKATALRDAGLSITTVKLPNKTMWSNGVMSTKSEIESEQNADKAKLEAAGFTVNDIQVSSVSGDYVTEVGGVTILTLPEGEDFNTAYNNMTDEEKEALVNAEKLKLMGTYTEDDFVQGLYKPENLNPNLKELDLSDAIIPTDMRLDRWHNSLEKLSMPTFAAFNKVPDNFVLNFTQLKDVNFPSNITEIGTSSFKNTGLEYLLLPSHITKVGESAFMECRNLERFDMEMLSAPCTFGANAFESCFALKHVSLSEGVPEISAHMFDKCGMLESIRIPTTAEYIRTGAFEGCASLHVITIPVGVKYIETLAFNNAALSDIYIMAESIGDVPQIISLGGNQASSFNTHQVNGDFNSPKEGLYAHHTPADAANLSEEELLHWYQEEQSNKNYEIGGNDCLVALHYPKSMENFYDGIQDPISGGTAWADNLNTPPNNLLRDRKGKEKWQNQIVPKLDNITLISQTYAIESGFSDYPTFIDEEGKGWPTTPDYEVCLAAGYAEGYSKLGWRQFPIKKGAKTDDFIFSKEYDDTWYTMCFPWDMEDNQLFSAFNQKLEITEFVGAEVVDATTDDDRAANKERFNLIFHFDKVANTYYMTKNHLEDKLLYKRIDDPVYTRTEDITVPGGTIKKKYYTYELVENPLGLNTPQKVYWPIGGRTTENAEMCDRYLGILHLMVFAGHPYMIHPSIGANPNLAPITCTIVGVTKLFPGDNAALEQLAADSVVTKRTTTDGESYNKPGTSFFKDESYYTFIGNINDYAANAIPRKKMTSPENPVAYFLAVDMDSQGNKLYPYPKYYRKSLANESSDSWSQYSAIIRPDAKAMEAIEQYMVLGTNSGSGAKGVDVQFGAWEVVTPTEIRQIIENAEEKGQEVKEINLNVVFNINGQVVRQGTTSVEGLPKGMYIVNGKKYMVK